MMNYLKNAKIGVLRVKWFRDKKNKLDFIFKETNKHFTTLLEIDSSKIIGSKNSGMPILNPLLADIEDFIQSKDKTECELEYKLEGKYLWVNMISVSAKELVLLFKATTSQVHLNRMKLRYEQLFEQSILPMFLIEPESNTIFEVNASAVQLTGYEKQELLCTHISKIIIENKTAADNLMKTVQKKSDLRQSNTIIITKSGRELFFDANYSHFTYDNRELILIGGIDVTDRKTREDELDMLNKTKDKFFSIIAHDLRAPLASIYSFTDLLNENFDEYDNSHRKELISYVYKSVTHMQRLLDNLLIWARSQRGTIEFNPQSCNLYQITNTAVDMLHTNARQKSIRLINRIPNQYMVFIDKDMISTVMRNLLGNAIKFSYKEGEIIIQAQRCNRNGDELIQVSVKDKGVGITEKALHSVFDIGEINSTPGTENEKGTGLGLVLCKEFIEKHGGNIWVESRLNKGSEFFFTLPLQ